MSKIDLKIGDAGRPWVFMAMVSMGLLFLSGCSQSDAPDVPPTEARQIRLSAGLSLVTRGVLGDDARFTVAVGGWETSGEAVFSSLQSWISTATVSGDPAGGDLVLSPERYYSQNGSVKTYMKAWYPSGTITNGEVAFHTSQDYVGDGTDDILVSTQAVGSALDADVKSFTFRHLTSQFRFVLTCDELFEGKGSRIRSIVIKNAGVPNGLNIANDNLICDSRDLTVPGIDGTMKIVQQPTAVGVPVMVEPFAGDVLLLDVTTDEVTYRDVRVRISDADAKPGKSYTVTLDFKGFVLSAKATVTPWDYTGAGSGEVEDN